MFPPNSPPAKVPPVPFIFSPSLLLHQELFLYLIWFQHLLFIYLPELLVFLPFLPLPFRLPVPPPHVPM